MANPFDQFDAAPQAASGNPFDQFDTDTHIEVVNGVPTSVKGKYKAPPTYDINEHAIGLGEAAIQAGSGIAALPLGMARMGVNRLLGGGDNPQPGEDRSAPLGRAMGEYTFEPRTDLGGRYASKVGDAFNSLGIPLMGVHIPNVGRQFNARLARQVPEAFQKAGVNLDKLPEAPKAEAPKRANPFDQFDLPLEFTEQQMAESRARDKTPGQADLFQNEGMDSIPPGNPPPINPETANHPSDAMLAQQARYRQAQATLAARQAAMEQDVGRQTGLDMGAADRARQEAAPVPGLEDARARALDESQQRTQPYMDESNQAPIDDNDHGYVANQYGGGQGGLRIDENGMPIRADRSMEAQNLENPLQRNLWGDELPRQSAQEAIRGITSAIDRMPPGEARQQGIGMLNGKQRGAIDFNALPEALLEKFRKWKEAEAAIHATSNTPTGTLKGKEAMAFRRLNAEVKALTKGDTNAGLELLRHLNNKQRGAIDLEAFTSGKKFKYIGDGTRLYFFQHPTEGPMIRAEREGRTVGELKLTTDTHFPRSDSNIEAAHVQVAPDMRGKGIAEKMYRFASEMGDVQASSTLLPDGRAMWQAFEKKGLANKEWTIPKGQRGVLYFGEGKNRKKFPNTPQMREQLATDLVRHIREQVSEDFPKVAEELGKNSINQIISEIVEAHGKHDPINYWMEKLAGTTEAEDPTLGGQLKPMGRSMYGQAKGPADLYPIKLSPEAAAQFEQFGQAVQQMWKEYRGDKLKALDARIQKLQDLRDARASGAVYEEDRQKMPGYQDAYRKQTHAIELYNSKSDQLAKSFADKYGIDPGQFSVDRPAEWDMPYDIWDVIHGLSDVVKDHIEYKAVPKGQRGGIDADAIHKALQSGMDKLGKFVEDVGGAKVSPHTPQEKVVLDALGNRNYIPRGDAPEAIISEALKGQDSKGLWTNLQSGLQSAGDKVRSPLMTGVARWLSYGEKMGDRYYNQKVGPLERALKGLSSNDLIAGQAVLRKGLSEGMEYTDAQLKDAGLSDKAIAAHNLMRQAFKDALDVTNASLRALDRKEIQPQEAYMASMWHGNWHVPVRDANGKLAWYIKAETKAEANKAIAYLKNDPELSKTLDLSEAQAKYHPENIGLKAPSDVMGAYQDMLSLFEGDTAAHMKQAMEAYMEGQGFRYLQHQKHFQNKTDVRGFMGDRPWLSDKDNAMTQAKAQIAYLKEAYRWAPMQEALAQIKEVLSSPELNKAQPNNMALTKAYTAQAMGVSRNLFKAAEQALQKAMTAGPGPVVSLLPGNIARFVGSLKNMTYLTQLGLSGGYMIATPLQAFLLGPARHLQLSGEGFTHGALQTSIKSLYDFSLGLLGHEVKNSFNTKYDMPMTPIGKAAFKYMEDNGIITQNIFHEASGLGEYAAVHGLKQAIGWTISMPEKIARAATFMSFAHHLDASGKFTTQAEMFRRAEELTNHTLTDFRRMSRPLAVDKMGQMGELAYTYKSPVFNQYNSLGEFARDAMKGKPGPLLAALGMTALLGGAVSLPFVNEADEAWNLVKNAVSKTWPTMYPKVAGLGIKGTIISKMNELSANDKLQGAIGAGPAKFLGDTAGYGAVSAATGSQMASRFSSAIGDISNPLGNIAPVGQEIKEWVGAGSSMANPTKNAATQAVYSAIAPPAVKGAMESHMDAFKTVKQADGQGYANPNHLEKHETSYIRTPDEEFKRNFGLTSLQEATTKNARYINQEESGRFKNAQDVSIDKMFDAITRKDKADVNKYAVAYFNNNGDGDGFEKGLDKKLDGYMFTPEQRAIIKAQSIAAIKNVIRMRKMQGKYAN